MIILLYLVVFYKYLLSVCSNKSFKSSVSLLISVWMTTHWCKWGIKVLYYSCTVLSFSFMSVNICFLYILVLLCWVPKYLQMLYPFVALTFLSLGNALLCLLLHSLFQSLLSTHTHKTKNKVYFLGANPRQMEMFISIAWNIFLSFHFQSVCTSI